MNILILGSGGREHALAWAVKQNPKCDRLIAAPGNPGIAMVAECADLDILDGDAAAAFCGENAIDLVIVGPEAPLAAGVADRLREAGVLVFGPSQGAATLEASKAFTKEVCDACGAPTAAWARFDALEEAKAHVRREGAPIVVKADGLAAGKGVTVAQTVDEALAALDAVFAGGDGSVVIEECLTGEEASFFVLCDGERMLPLGTAQDHKRVGEGDTGPNTGGMGAYTPLPWLPESARAAIVRDVIEPVAAELLRRGCPFSGLLYAGLAMTSDGPAVVEFNCRFGDPETQAVLALLESPLGALLYATATGTLAGAEPLRWRDGYAVTVVLAAENYPGRPRFGDVITGSDNDAVLHAGTARRDDGEVVSCGGRVLSVVGTGADLPEARAAAYRVMTSIRLPGSHFRTDIGLAAAEGRIGV